MNTFKLNPNKNRVTFDSVDVIELDSLEAGVNDFDYETTDEVTTKSAKKIKQQLLLILFIGGQTPC